MYIYIYAYILVTCIAYSIWEWDDLVLFCSRDVCSYCNWID